MLQKHMCPQLNNGFAFSVDPMTAIRQYCDMLVRQGRMREVDQITQELLRRRSQQFAEGSKKRKL